MKQKIFIILRHGKAEIGAPAQEDHSRALVSRGQEAAFAMGQYLQQESIVPDQVSCSTAKRTRQTYEYLAKAYTNPPAVSYSDSLYHANPAQMLKAVSTVSEECQTLLLIGHNPGLHQLCLQLARDDHSNLTSDLALNFPTCALAIFSFTGLWATLPTSEIKLQTFTTPKKLVGMGED